VNEPAKKLINQGMIQGRSNTIVKFLDTPIYISDDLMDEWGLFISNGIDDNNLSNHIVNTIGLRLTTNMSIQKLEMFPEWLDKCFTF